MVKERNYSGLRSAEVEEARRRYGVNVLTPAKGRPWWREFLDKFSDPLIIILLVAGILSIGISIYEYLGLKESWEVFFEPIGIFAAIFMATGLAYIFERRANQAFKLLNQVNDDESVEVVRDGESTTIGRRDVVVGDLVILSTGDEIPADGQLVESVAMSVDESTLTGEPLCHKSIRPEDNDEDATYPTDEVLRGTKIMEGHGRMKVTRVGDSTEMGKVYKESQIDDSVKTPLNEQLGRLGKLITGGSYIVAGLVIVGQVIHYLGWGNPGSWLPAVAVAIFFWLVIKYFPRWNKAKCIASIVVAFASFFGLVALAFTLVEPNATTTEWSALTGHTLQTIMVAVTLIVVAVPEGLPMAVTLSLAYSMSRMLKTNNLVRKMHACETMGAATVICTDKTGTLTENRMQVAHIDIFGNRGKETLAEGIAVNSTAELDLNDKERPTPIGNPTEGALLLWLRKQGEDYRSLRGHVEREEELPFSTERKYMATVVKRADGKRMLYVKGAPEIVYAMCSDKNGVSEKEIDVLLVGYQNEGMRTLGFAYAELPGTESGKIIDNKELRDAGLTFSGIAAISDPVRKDVPEAVRQVTEAGIKIKIVTGDTPATAKEIGRQIGLWEDGRDGDRNIATGPEVAGMSDKELAERAQELKIIARARPLDKKRLVEALQSQGEVVAVTGDGTNDAPALKAAHVGLSMGDGTSVAKEASDITIIDNSFASIGRAVMWGRSLYRNIQRFLLFQLTVNVAACLLVLFGSFLGTESPLTVTQMLWVNLIMDTFGAMALASLPPSESVMREKPRDRKASILTCPMIAELTSVGVLFFIITYAFYWIFIHADITRIWDVFTPEILSGEGLGTREIDMTAVDSGLLFSVFVWTHFFYMFNARAFATGKSIFRLKMSQGFWTIVGVIVIGQLFITELGYRFFNVAPMLHTEEWGFNTIGSENLALIIVMSSLVIWVRELWHLRNRDSRKP